MKYPKIASLVPAEQKEAFTEGETTEGSWITTGHMANIESQLASIASLQESLTALTAAATQNATTISTLTAQLETANNQIATLQQENADLGGTPSGEGTVLATVKDDEPGAGKTKKLSLNDPDHPFNQKVARKIKKK